MARNFVVKKRYTIAERRKRIIEVMHDKPGISQSEVARIVGCDKGTVARDLKAITEELQITNRESWLVHRERVLKELEIKKNMCNRRLKALESSPHQGSRWLEEWARLVDKEIKILGLNSPDRLMVDDLRDFSKKDVDAAVTAVLDSIVDDVDFVDNKRDKDLFKKPEESKLLTYKK
ncbi:hypothetical protein DRH14_04325 [Candidatus Shapirobacteria bacterium]|nr:MAG: hypothetical protein DRH14_04325 [Candidatus Shapirobacteria bacterium]RLI53342.1 MAG: hypothetical protein DRP09_15985 [Candidatus Thorarchaeota archaeon]